MEKISKIFHDESGVSATEYGLVLLLIITIVAGMLGLIGTSISNRFINCANYFGS